MLQVAYSAQDEHAVQAVTAGERFTLTIWFTLDPEHNEDPKLLACLTGPCHHLWTCRCVAVVKLPAWLTVGQTPQCMHHMVQIEIGLVVGLPGL